MTDAPVVSASPWPSSSPAVSQPPQTVPGGLAVGFVGTRGALFWLALKTGFFTVLTLGFYRFWMKTRLRRWYWSAIRPGGHPLEYVGDPWEKLLGFFIAVVILTFYIGIVNLLLMFLSFSVFNSSWLGYAASFVGMVPIWFYATYRARRYVLARTRWRGVRFGLEKGAWGYAGRAVIHLAITVMTLGILWPRMTFALEKYRTDRTFFGSARLHQGGRWPMLYRAAVPFALGLLAGLAVLVWAFWLDPVMPNGLDDVDAFFDDLDELMLTGAFALDWRAPQRLLLIPVALAGMLYGAIHYRWVCKRLMANHKSAAGVRLRSTLSGPRVAMIYVLGNFLSYMLLFFGVLALVLLGMAAFGTGMLLMWNALDTAFANWPKWALPAVLAILYVGVFLLWGVFYNTFVTFPLIRHMARSTSLPETDGIGAISQRDRDAFAEAEGFAEALDLGAAI